MTLRLKLKSILLTAAVAMTLQGCSSSDDVASLPAPLPVVKNPQPVGQLWLSTDADGTDEFYSVLRPVVGYDKVFIASRSGDIYAYEKFSGDWVWASDIRKQQNSIWVTLGFDDEEIAKVAGGIVASYKKVFFGTENGEVIALDEATGKVVWRSKVKGEVLAKPAVDKGLVFVQTGSGLVYALDAETGEEKWMTESEVPVLTIRGTASPVYANGGVIVGGANGKVSVYLAETGQLAWEQAVAKPAGSTELERVVDVDATPIVLGSLIYSVSYGGKLTAMEMRNGRVVWDRDYSGFVDMVASGNELFVVDNQSNIYALDRRNGVEKWSSSELLNREITAPVIHEGKLAVGDFEGFIHWFNAETGKIEAQYLADIDGLNSSPYIERERLYVQGKSGKLSALVFAGAKITDEEGNEITPRRSRRNEEILPTKDQYDGHNRF
ncbi:outer membrane protein assembly factor BamB [Saccharobesus litoralis]|uniref:Outer membrane protein assembly factor BamB n=1 Tax=Saccharobesus litoralis TaxID=2172099 RepID=A0A2S0VVG2_9ALTE|nr:outer membrane protein assembly factor BamB [Saccharobesus litoralis]AWB68214.1 outer membrane protein assembly factor BamB [Saccharobesus litoralis]